MGLLNCIKKTMELVIWVAGRQNEGKKEQRSFISTADTSYFTNQSEAISWFF